MAEGLRGGTTTVFLLRHAESTVDPALPESDWPLSEAGLRQASELCTTLAPLGIDHVVSSPFVGDVYAPAPVVVCLQQPESVVRVPGGFQRLVDGIGREPEFLHCEQAVRARRVVGLLGGRAVGHLLAADVADSRE